MSSAEVAKSYGYTPGPINVDLGCAIRTSEAGRRVYMYKSKPGMYMYANGQFASDDHAREAGFDIESDRRKAQVEGMIASYNREVRLQQAENEARIRAGLPPEVLAKLPAMPAAVVEKTDDELITELNEKGEPRGTQDFKLVHIGGGRFNVVNREDETQIDNRLVVEDAVAVMIKAQRALDDSRSSG